MVLGSIFNAGVPIDHYIILSTVLFVIGALGVMIRRNAIILLMCIELMLNAVNLLLVAFSTYFGKGDGQVFVFFIMAAPFVGSTLNLVLGTLLFAIPQITSLSLEDKDFKDK